MSTENTSPSSAIPIPPTPERTKGPDGETIKDWAYYDLLGVQGNATDIEIKKAYRKLAIKLHPDKNVGDEGAAARFQEVSEAYTVLSDSNLRAVYNKQGKTSDIEGAAEAMPDPGQMFSQMFGGAAFMDWIGEISLGKDVSKAFEMSTTEEEREEMKAEYAKEVSGASSPSATPSPAPAPAQSSLSHTAFEEPPTYTSPTSPHIVVGDDKSPKGPSTTSISNANATASSPSPATSTAADHAAAAEKKAAAEKEKKEQREKMEAYEKERSEEKKERVRTLIVKLKDRIRPMVDAKDPGNGEDPEVKRYSERIRIETQDLAMESFGIEICHLIGEIYMQKASSYIRLHKKPSSNILGIPAWGSRMKEKWSTVKEGFSFLSVGLDVQSAMADMERRQAKGELDEDEMKGLESDLSGKLLLVAWKGSKFELSNVLRQVVDGALLKEPGVTDQILMNRAKAILLTGAILKSVVPDESDSERRELERMVAEANAKRKEKGKKGAKGAKVGTATPPKVASPSV